MDKQYPKIVVGCFILNDQKEILLVRSYKWPNLWVVMGGHIEWGEHIANAVVRETKEEVGLDVQFDHLIEVVEFVNDPAFHQSKHFVGLQCKCHVVGDSNPKIDHEEIQEANYFSLEEAANLSDILPQTRSTLQKLLSTPL